jgi:hypothetical protein
MAKKGTGSRRSTGPGASRSPSASAGSTARAGGSTMRGSCSASPRAGPQHVVQGQPDEGGGARGRGRMRPAGHAEVERAKADGRWDRAYDGVATATVPDDLAAALQDAGMTGLRRAELGQPLRDPPPRPDGEEARDARPPDRPVRGDARRRAHAPALAAFARPPAAR